jgi:hypothetical protein
LGRMSDSAAAARNNQAATGMVWVNAPVNVAGPEARNAAALALAAGTRDPAERRTVGGGCARQRLRQT